LFHEILTEGMTVLDIGANVGYYSLIAGKLVGDKGKVYAFEPCNQSYSILQKNIEANNFKNIIPIKKALTDVIGKQRLFLCDDPVGNSLVMRDDNKFEDVEVTTVDLFVNDQNISVDLIKMDVEGAEMRTLEGMKKTILNNPKLKIITEFMPQNLEKSGCAPVKFLERLMDLDFNLYLMNEEAHTHQMITRNNMNDIINTLDGKYWTLTNIYCYKEYNNNSI
jgi:FkbM family methyltransferase